MIKSLEYYYQAEMELLDVALQNFARQHPDVAGRMKLDSRSRDPHIELLLHGSAYLQARVKEQIDLGVHHVSESLLRHLAPQYLMPRPSKTIVEFSSLKNQLIFPEIIPAGVKLVSKPVGDEHTVLEFITEEEIVVNPFHLVACEWADSLSSQSVLKLSFKLNEGTAPASIRLGLLPLFINAPSHVCKQWKYDLLQNVSEVSLKQSLRDGQRIGGQEVLTAKQNKTAFRGSVDRLGAMHVAGEYFHFPEQFYFVQLDLSGIQISGENFEIFIAFRSNHTRAGVSLNLFKLHCVSACNAFHAHCEPIRYENTQHEYALIIDQQKPSSQTLLHVQKVWGINKKTSEHIEFRDFFKLSAPLESQYHYRVSQAPGTSHLPHFKLIFSGNLPESLLISCDALACNGQYPWLYLSKNELRLNDERISMQLVARNLMKPGRYAFVEASKDYAAKGLALLHARISRLTEEHFLKQLLHFMDWSGSLCSWIESIIKVDLHPICQLKRGILTQRIVCEIMIEEEQFKSFAEIYAFGDFLHRVLSIFAPYNALLDTRLMAMPSKQGFFWHG